LYEIFIGFCLNDFDFAPFKLKTTTKLVYKLFQLFCSLWIALNKQIPFERRFHFERNTDAALEKSLGFGFLQFWKKRLIRGWIGCRCAVPRASKSVDVDGRQLPGSFIAAENSHVRFQVLAHTLQFVGCPVAAETMVGHDVAPGQG
jgi:hypothetical protein